MSNAEFIKEYGKFEFREMCKNICIFRIFFVTLHALFVERTEKTDNIYIIKINNGTFFIHARDCN